MMPAGPHSLEHYRTPKTLEVTLRQVPAQPVAVRYQVLEEEAYAQ
jgi:hypothetical protein